jgi:O-methyltransferase domain/Dimerisation domain
VSTAEEPPPGRLWRLLRGSLTVQALHVAAELGVADELASGPLPVAELARRSGAHADTLHRVLRALASEGVFAEEHTGEFRNTEASELLFHGGEWHAFAHFFGGAWFRTLGETLHAARTGDETFTRVFGEPWWTWLQARPEETTLFNRAMQGGAANRADIFAAEPWDSETVVDVGGGNGTLLVELLRRHGSLRGIVFDLPEVARDAERRIAEAGLTDRCRVVEGSFFDGVPAGGDAYLLKSILHDWDDASAEAILRRVRAAAPAHARVLISDAVVESGNEPDESKWLDLLMLTLNRGRERTEPEWRALLDRSGLGLVRIADLIEARCR